LVRTIKKMSATLFVDPKLPSEYWSYAARYAAVTLMKTSARDPSLWTSLTGRASGIDSLRRFGQRYNVQIPREARRKNDLSVGKGEPGIQLGHSETISGWIVRRDQDGAVLHSRDIRLLYTQRRGRQTTLTSTNGTHQALPPSPLHHPRFGPPSGKKSWRECRLKT
jgi:hypothetical protein